MMEERPIECSGCKKEPTIVYHEVTQNSKTITHMCDGCPMLDSKLHGNPEGQTKENSFSQKSLVCLKCGTSLEQIKMGNLLGCDECYNIFSDLLKQELIASSVINPNLKKSSPSFHIGKTPSLDQEYQGNEKLSHLNSALGDALKKENYEQAAYLRDQINEIMEK